MRDDEPPRGGIIRFLLMAFASVLVAVALAVGLFFGVCSMMLRR
jgi:hypothetical protein